MLKTTATFAGLALAALSLAGCVEEGPAAAGNEPEAQARANCVRAVQATTGNSDVAVTSSEFSQAGTRVILRVGPTGTWQCMAYLDGSTSDIMSLTDEGGA